MEVDNPKNMKRCNVMPKGVLGVESQVSIPILVVLMKLKTVVEVVSIVQFVIKM